MANWLSIKWRQKSSIKFKASMSTGMLKLKKSGCTIFGFKHCFCWIVAQCCLHKGLCSQELQQSGFRVAHFRPHSWKSLMDSAELSSDLPHPPFFTNCGLLTNTVCFHFLHKECFRGILAQGLLPVEEASAYTKEIIIIKRKLLHCMNL